MSNVQHFQLYELPCGLNVLPNPFDQQALGERSMLCYAAVIEGSLRPANKHTNAVTITTSSAEELSPFNFITNTCSYVHIFMKTSPSVKKEQLLPVVTLLNKSTIFYKRQERLGGQKISSCIDRPDLS